MLRRLGRKDPKKYLPYFPERVTTFIDMFMGSGAITFAMLDRARYIIANDNDDNVYNLFIQVKEHKEELLEALEIMPAQETLFHHWKESGEQEPIWKAVRFLMLSNFGLWGQPASMGFIAGALTKRKIMNDIKSCFLATRDIQFMSCDFRQVLHKINWKVSKKNAKIRNEYRGAFIYADPPYLGTGNNYAESFTEEDTRDLFSILTSSGIRFALSEFRHPLVIALAEEHDLHITSLGERRNLKNRREEILITNYPPERRQVTVFDVLNQQAGQHNKRMVSDKNRPPRLVATP